MRTVAVRLFLMVAVGLPVCVFAENAVFTENAAPAPRDPAPRDLATNRPIDAPAARDLADRPIDTPAAQNFADGPIEMWPAADASEAAFDTFLDRLMRAESNGRDLAANPRSTALGPFQFIKATFIDVARRHFAAEVAALSDDGVLALRTDRAFARRAAAAYSKETLAYLGDQGLKPTFGHLRLAYLVGPSAAARLLQAQPQTPVAEILSAPVLVANPFMRGMSATELIARATRDVGEHPNTSVATAPGLHVRAAASRAGPRGAPRPTVQAPAIAISCNQKLASCRRWVAMQINKQQVAKQRASRTASRNGAPGKKEQRPGV